MSANLQKKISIEGIKNIMTPDGEPCLESPKVPYCETTTAEKWKPVATLHK